MNKTVIYVCTFLAFAVFCCNDGTNTKITSQIVTEKHKYSSQLDEFEKIDTIRDNSFDKDKLLKIDSLLKVKLTHRIKFDDLYNDYELIPLTPNFNAKAILIYSVLAHSTKLVTFTDKLELADVYEASSFSGFAIEDDNFESVEKYSIFKKDSLISHNITIDEVDGKLDTISFEKEVFVLNNDRLIKK